MNSRTFESSTTRRDSGRCSVRWTPTFTSIAARCATQRASCLRGQMRERLTSWGRAVLDVVKAAYRDGVEHELPLFAPAMAYALVVSLAPLTLALNVFGALLLENSNVGIPGSPFDTPQVTPELMVDRVAAWAGPFASVIALLLVAYGATALYSELVTAIRRIWRQESGPKGLKALVHGRVFAFLLLLATAVGLFLSAVVGTALAGFTQILAQVGSVAGLDLQWLHGALNSRLVLDFLFATVLYTIAFTVVPHVRPRVRDVLPGSLLTAFAYAVGQRVLAAHLTSSGRFDALGAFGAFLGFLVWAYYTALIVLWGAELTYQIAMRRGCARGEEDARVYQCDPEAQSSTASGETAT